MMLLEVRAHYRHYDAGVGRITGIMMRVEAQARVYHRHYDAGGGAGVSQALRCG